MKHSLHTNYQTCFRIVRDNDDTYFDVIRLIFNWLCSKDNNKFLTKIWEEFSLSEQWSCSPHASSKITTASLIEDDKHRAWAMEYNHQDRQLGPKRFWHTFVGVRDNGNVLIIAARVAYSWNNEDLSIEVTTPSPNVPIFIHSLIDKFITYSGRKEFRLINKPISLNKIGSGILVWNFISSHERNCPMIVFNGDDDQHIREANSMAKELAGKAYVVVLAKNPELGKEIKSTFPKEFYIGYSMMRVFFPLGSGSQSSKRHRWFHLSSNDYIDQRAGIVNGLLRNHNLQESEAVECINDIQRLIFKSNIVKLKDSSKNSNEEEIEANYKKYIIKLEEKLISIQNEASEYAQYNDKLEFDLYSAKCKINSFKSARKDESTKDYLLGLLSKWPEKLSDVVHIASNLYSDKLIFAQEAFFSAEENASCILVSDAWNILYHLATTLHDLVFSTKCTGDLAKMFKLKSGYEYAQTEGKQTKSDEKLNLLRKITHNGKDYEIWPHIKKGNEGNKMIRIHFDFDHIEKKIIVGYVGLHMKNASSRRMK